MGPWVMLWHDGIGPYSFEPDAPSDDNTFRTIQDAKRGFQRVNRESYRDGVPTEGGGPWADLYPLECWDGISYGDSLCVRFEVGPRGGLQVSNA